jgi:hypothetical protein
MPLRHFQLEHRFHRAKHLGEQLPIVKMAQRDGLGWARGRASAAAFAQRLDDGRFPFVGQIFDGRVRTGGDALLAAGTSSR